MIDKLIKLVREGFEEVKDPRRKNSKLELPNLLSLAFSMFHLKDSSLSSFREQYSVRAENLERVYGVNTLPGDTALRESIDKVLPSELQVLFKPLFVFLKQQGVFKERHVLGEYTAVSVDGTGHYCSSVKGCPQCMVKKHRNGKTTYYHQLLGAVAVHPNQSSVFPVACEAIIKQDGSKKNDCELNASKRIIPQIRAALGDEKIIAIFDALYINGPHIRALIAESMSYIIGTKGQTYVDVQVETLRKKNQLESLTWKRDGKKCTINFTNGLILNGQYQEILTNYFEYTETEIKSGKQLFYSTWITDLEITQDNVQELVKVARSQWKIENETFNTLKGCGFNLMYKFEL